MTIFTVFVNSHNKEKKFKINRKQCDDSIDSPTSCSMPIRLGMKIIITVVIIIIVIRVE